MYCKGNPNNCFIDWEIIDYSQIDCTLDRKWTKKEVLDSSLNLAYYLSHDLGIKKGDIVCFATNNSDIHAIAIIGVLAAGAVYCSFQEDCPECELW